MLLRNAPASSGNRATVLDLDLEKIISGLDEERSAAPCHRDRCWRSCGISATCLAPSSRKEHEVFLEFEAPRARLHRPPRLRHPRSRRRPTPRDLFLRR